MKKMSISPEWLRAEVTARPIGVDRENHVIRGAVVAQAGAFREPNPRGEFDNKSLKAIVRLMKADSAGLKARFGHPSLSNDAAGTAIGRWQNPFMSSVQVTRAGAAVELEAVRGDLHLDPSSGQVNPNGDLRDYLETVAESDPGLISTSLVLQVEEEYRLERDGMPQKDAAGNALPPLWRPTVLHAGDITDEGAAVDRILSPRGGADLPDDVVRLATRALDRLFAGQSRHVIEARCSTWLERYLALRFGQESPQNAPAKSSAGPAAGSGDARSPGPADGPPLTKSKLRQLLTLTDAAALA